MGPVGVQVTFGQELRVLPMHADVVSARNGASDFMI